MKTTLTISVILLSLIVSGQIVLTGTVRDYENKEVLPFTLVCADSIDIFKGFSIHKPIDTTYANLNGDFELETQYRENINLIITFMGYVPLTISNIKIDNENQEIELGNIYIPFRGQWVEGYKPPEGETKKETRKKRKEWRKNNDPIPINWAGFSPDFFEPYKGLDTIYLDYPPSGIKKEFLIKEENLIIEYSEFMKK